MSDVSGHAGNSSGTTALQRQITDAKNVERKNEIVCTAMEIIVVVLFVVGFTILHSSDDHSTISYALTFVAEDAWGT